MLNFDFVDVFYFLLFLLGTFFGGKVFAFLGLPAYVGEIAAGCIFGPHLADVVVFPEAFSLLGELGLILLTIEIGMAVDTKTIFVVGTRVLHIALFAGLLSYAFGCIVALMAKHDTDIALAIGCVFVPSGFTVSYNILRSFRLYNRPVGVLLKASAIILDIAGIVLLSLVYNLDKGDNVAWEHLSGLVLCLGLMLFSVLVNNFILPIISNTDLVKNFIGRLYVESYEWLQMLFILCVLLAFLPATYYASAHYLVGAYVTGFFFSGNVSIRQAWMKHGRFPMICLMRLFFACRIGFTIPIQDIWTEQTFLDMASYMVPVLGKVIAGIVATSPITGLAFLEVASSLAIWSEYSFYIALLAFEGNLIDEKLYSSLVLTFIISSLIFPALLRIALWMDSSSFDKKMKELTNKENTDHVFYCVQVKSVPEWRHQDHIKKCVLKLGYQIVDYRIWHYPTPKSPVYSEFYLEDQNFHIPAQIDLPEVDNQRLQDAVENLHRALRACLSQEKPEITITRWLPGGIRHQDIIQKISNKKVSKGFDDSLEEGWKQKTNTTWALHNIMTNHSRFSVIEEEPLNIGHLFDGYVHTDYHNLPLIWHNNDRAKAKDEAQDVLHLEEPDYRDFFGPNLVYSRLPQHTAPTSKKGGLLVEVLSYKDADPGSVEFEVEILHQSADLTKFHTDDQKEKQVETTFIKSCKMLQDSGVVEI